MQVKEGSTRLVFIGERQVVKIPRPRKIAVALGNWNYERKELGWRTVLLAFFGDEDQLPSNMQGLEGASETWREGRVCPAIREIVVPIRSFAGGLIGMQPVARDIPENLGSDLRHEVWKTFGNDNIIEGNAEHTLAWPVNYGIWEGKIRLRDYGENGAGTFLVRHRRKLQEIFRSFSREGK